MNNLTKKVKGGVMSLTWVKVYSQVRRNITEDQVRNQVWLKPSRMIYDHARGQVEGAIMAVDA